MAWRIWSDSSKKILDPVRGCWVEATPEERVRQGLLQKMIGELGYPKSLIAVERPLKSMPHLYRASLPDRRADIVCFASGIHPDWPFYPLLLIECKSSLLHLEALAQVRGYNHFVGAYFIAAVNAQEIFLEARYGGGIVQLSTLPSFQELLHVYRK